MAGTVTAVASIITAVCLVISSAALLGPIWLRTRRTERIVRRIETTLIEVHTATIAALDPAPLSKRDLG